MDVKPHSTTGERSLTNLGIRYFAKIVSEENKLRLFDLNGTRREKPALDSGKPINGDA
jgi:hypothetical protein